MVTWKKFPYEIGWARTEEWIEIMDMIWRTFMQFEARDYSEEGIANFKDFITDSRLYRMFVEGQYPMLVARDGERIIGQISVRNSNHISLLFVEEEYHKKGVGRQLIKSMGEYLKGECRQRYMTVQAAPYAVEFYRKVGFRVCSPETQYAGIRVTAMEKQL